MKGMLTIIIGQEGAKIIHPDNITESGPITPPDAMRGALSDFCSKHSISTTRVMLYVAEELLFYKEAPLPLKTRDLDRAVSFQLEMLTPYKDDDVLYSYTSRRRKDHHQISLVATGREKIEAFAEAIAGAGYTLEGLFPESQRYVARTLSQNKWALVLPGRFFKVFKFTGTHLEERLFCGAEPAFDDLAKLCESESIYHLSPPAGSSFLAARPLLDLKPAHKEFNLLPKRFHQPDYFRMAIIGLVILNIVALLGTLGARQISLARSNNQLDARIEELALQFAEVKKLQNEEKEIAAEIQKVTMTSSNPDIILILSELGDRLPKNSYLDMIRLDGNNTLQIQGYTSDINELTATLQNMGRAQLKSTRRMRDKTYFQIEINLI